MLAWLTLGMSQVPGEQLGLLVTGIGNFRIRAASVSMVTTVPYYIIG
jgi:hypothetical protein